MALFTRHEMCCSSWILEPKGFIYILEPKGMKTQFELKEKTSLCSKMEHSLHGSVERFDHMVRVAFLAFGSVASCYQMCVSLHTLN